MEALTIPLRGAGGEPVDLPRTLLSHGLVSLPPMAVEDDGIGVGAEFAGQLFGMFARERRSDCPGTGIGLAICRKIVEHHGGRIWLDTSVPSGTTFRFTLPARPEASNRLA